MQNIKKYCALRGIKPTIACVESGAGKDIINQLEKRGSIPSIERVQLLAQYLGVTVSDLLGEKKDGPTPVSESVDEPVQEFIQLYERLSDEEKTFVIRQLKGLLAENRPD